MLRRPSRAEHQRHGRSDPPLSCRLHRGRRRGHLSGWQGFRAAMAGVTGEETEETVVTPLLRGTVGALVRLIFVVALLLMFGAGARGFLAHAVGKPTSSFTPVRLLVAAVLLGFGTGFIVPVPKATKQPPNPGN